MTLHIATDHAGFEHKEVIVSWLREEGFDVVDHGSFVLDSEDDYPDFISLAASAVNETPSDKGIIFGGSGQGEAMMANSYPKVRAAVYYGGDETIPVLSRQHNDSNILSIGARFVDLDTTKRVIWNWIHTEPFVDEKYSRRNNKLEKITSEIHS